MVLIKVNYKIYCMNLRMIIWQIMIKLLVMRHINDIIQKYV